MKYQLVTTSETGLESEFFSDAAAIEIRGHTIIGHTEPTKGRIQRRPELVGRPMFRDLIGPMWGGQHDGEDVVRYEDAEAYRILCE